MGEISVARHALEGSPDQSNNSFQSFGVGPGRRGATEVIRACATSICALFDDAQDCTKIFKISNVSAQVKIPEEIISVLRMGQTTALQNVDGRNRGMVVSDVHKNWWHKPLRTSS